MIIKILPILLFLSSYSYANFREIENFGTNPGELKMFTFIPETARPDSPLVILTHGCEQSAEEFTIKSGWKKLAIKHGLKLLLPEQSEENNSYKCFNWFLPSDFLRNQGEAKSIIEMLAWLELNSSIDSKNIYISGLSAGAAMANTLLANYPEIFKAGSIIAGVPYGCATRVLSAWMCMYGTQMPPTTPQGRGDAVRAANPGYTGPWPSVLVIHGTKDDTVNYSNALYLLGQWANVHNLNLKDKETISLNKHEYTHYGSSKVGLITVPNQKHGYPIDPSNGCGEEGKYFLDSGLCAAYKSLEFFEILP